MDCACDASWRFGGLASGCNTAVQKRLIMEASVEISKSGFEFLLYSQAWILKASRVRDSLEMVSIRHLLKF